LTLYLDTSVLVAVHTREAATARVQEWLVSRYPEELLISDWTITEFSSALSIKLRTGQIDVSMRADALQAFAAMRTDSLTVVPVGRRQFHTAALFADNHATGLRGADALHLAVCADHTATLCTLDRRLAAAGPLLGLKTLLV